MRFSKSVWFRMSQSAVVKSEREGVVRQFAEQPNGKENAESQPQRGFRLIGQRVVGEFQGGF